MLEKLVMSSRLGVAAASRVKILCSFRPYGRADYEVARCPSQPPWLVDTAPLLQSQSGYASLVPATVRFIA